MKLLCTVGPASECRTVESDTSLQSGVLENITAVLHVHSGALNNITENSEHKVYMHMYVRQLIYHNATCTLFSFSH